ncbi:class II D-tagatose-bisphosphate aldolase, non-catalytic subunit [Mycoplasmatota bacterium WC44]
MKHFKNILENQHNNIPAGIYSVCSSNKYVIEAALVFAKNHNTHLLIEATSNQVDQYGGYTGMKPKDFIEYVRQIALGTDFDQSKLIFGGDHLGPNPFQHMNENEAMLEAEKMIRQYVLAGFSKIHLDCSMRLADDSRNDKLSTEIIAKRTARLAKIAEESYKELKEINNNAIHPIYVIGSEVPIPGGAQANHEEIAVTSKEDFAETVEITKKAFLESVGKESWKFVVACVVQPGVEFADNHIDEYSRKNALDLMNSLKNYKNLVFEGHSTDYQTPEKLKEMVEDGVGILKVGPQLSFALREALFSLSYIENELIEKCYRSNFKEILLGEMLNNPKHWQKHYDGDIEYKCKFSLLDRCRYYLENESVKSATNKLLSNLESSKISLTLLSQFMPNQYRKVRVNSIENKPIPLIFDRIHEVLDIYQYATNQE